MTSMPSFALALHLVMVSLSWLARWTVPSWVLGLETLLPSWPWQLPIVPWASTWTSFALQASPAWCQDWGRLQLELLWVRPHVPELRHNWPPRRSASWVIRPSGMADVCWSEKVQSATVCSVVWMWAWWQPTSQTWDLPSTRPWMWTSARQALSASPWMCSRASQKHFAPSTSVVLWPTSVRLLHSSISLCFTARTDWAAGSQQAASRWPAGGLQLHHVAPRISSICE